MLRWIIALLSLSAVVALSAPARAGSYLDRAALLLEETRREGDMLSTRVHDKELVAVIRVLAEARTRAAQAMEVPTSVHKAHPHLLLVLENAERAAAAAAAGQSRRFAEHLYRARDEERIFRAILAELRYTLPELRPSR